MKNPIDFNDDGKLDKQDVGSFWTRLKALFSGDPITATLGFAIVIFLAVVLTKMFWR